ncbi:MAG: hypothetical protein IJ272_09145 [Clostridia bacterium]|nr:hypothetical protein [Clostridia bacterium]
MSRKERRDKVEKKEKQVTQKKPKEISIFTVLFVVVLIAALVGIYFGVRYLVITLRYKEYTDKVISYGYNELYNNQKAAATQKVTNAELLKVVLGSIQNNKDISSLYYLADEKTTESSNWYDYSVYLGINDFMDKGDLDKNATRIDAIMFVVKSLENLVDVELGQSTLEIDKSKLSKFTQEEQTLIAKAITLGVISNEDSSLADSELIKGELNKLVISVVEEYATMHHDTTAIGENGEIIRQNVSIVTDKEKLPTNSKEYPYVVDSIEKQAYEWDYQILTERTFKNPKETYKVMGYLYGQTDDLIVRYFNKILNVDYTTITTKDFLQSITNEVTYLLDEQDVKAYVDYVKQHKIKLEGSATPLLPIMYNNGEQYVVRTKLTFKVLSSDTENNLLFGDENNTVKYNSKEITMYVDVPMGMTLNSKSLLVYVSCLAGHISNENTMVVLEK